MGGFLNKIAGQELFLVYGLIALVVILIVIIIIIDRAESHKKKKTLFDTLNMRIVNEAKNEIIEPIHAVEVKQQETSENDFSNIDATPTVTESLKEAIESIDDDIYVESDLEKTQAQIRVEEITNALKESKVDDKKPEDDYAKFEEEQEQNAIISYNELKESYDKLYSENEKIQYLEDDEIPINIEELYELHNQKEKKEEIEKVTLDDFTGFSKPAEENLSSFKSSPLISPVYGIQSPPIDNRREVDSDITDTNQFLQNLKELKNNLD